VRPHSVHAGLPPVQARRLAASSPRPCYYPPGLPHDRGTSGEQVSHVRSGGLQPPPQLPRLAIHTLCQRAF
jgi:hypothetical protein